MKFSQIPSRQRGLITKGIRDSFKRDARYKLCLANARIEVPRYKKDGGLMKVPNVYFTCNYCGRQRKQGEVQVDHIKPVIRTNEVLADFTLDEYASRVFSGHVQILCRDCHDIKSKSENKCRRAYKKSLKNKIK